MQALTYSDYTHDPAGGFRQRDLTITQTYDAAYVDRYVAIEAQSRALSAQRLQVLVAITGPGTARNLLDFGCGAGHFVDAAMRHGVAAYGHDVIYHGPDTDGDGWNRSRFLPELSLCPFACAARFDVVTFFDSLEHLVDPAVPICALRPRWLMVSVPECHYPDDADWFMAWRHRRPGEHLWHWHRDSLREFLLGCGYGEVMVSSFEDYYRPHPGQAEPNILTGIYRRASST